MSAFKTYIAPAIGFIIFATHASLNAGSMSDNPGPPTDNGNPGEVRNVCVYDPPAMDPFDDPESEEAKGIWTRYKYMWTGSTRFFGSWTLLGTSTDGVYCRDLYGY